LVAIVEQQREYLRSYPSSIRRKSKNESDDPSENHSLMAASISPSCLTPIVGLVNGRAAEVVFTPQSPDNLYRIEGCGFGAERGEVRIEPDSHVASSGTRARPIPLRLNASDAWSDIEINVRLDPRISGVADSSVTLIVQRADGTRLEFSGCYFVALRGPAVLLKAIPASWVKLDATTALHHPIRQLEFLSPPIAGEEVPGDATETSALIVRSDAGEFGSGADAYDFSALQPGWVVESVQVQRYPGTCPGDVTRAGETDTWRTAFDAHGFQVAWASNSCSSFIPPVFHFTMTSSEYALKVWVMGPVGTEAIARALAAVKAPPVMMGNPSQ